MTILTKNQVIAISKSWAKTSVEHYTVVLNTSTETLWVNFSVQPIGILIRQFLTWSDIRSLLNEIKQNRKKSHFDTVNKNQPSMTL